MTLRCPKHGIQLAHDADGTCQYCSRTLVSDAPFGRERVPQPADQTPAEFSEFLETIP